VVSLVRNDGSWALAIEDDGLGIPEAPVAPTGLGLHIMNYRANMVGGTLEIRPSASGGTLVRCGFPIRG